MELLSIEDQIIKAVIKVLLEGYVLDVFDGEEMSLIKGTDPDAIFNAMKATEMDYLYVYTPQYVPCMKTGYQCKGWVLFVYGNGIDVVSDYTVGLSGVLEDVMAMVAEYEITKTGDYEKMQRGEESS